MAAELKGVGIGAGYFSQFHYDAWRRIDGIQLSAICDVDAGRARGRAEEFGIPRWYTDVEEMLDAEQPDFVDIITRPETHLELVREVARRGLAIICQKPLAPTWQEAVELVREAERAGVRLMVHENFRFQPWHRQLKRCMEDGLIGDTLHTIGCQTRLGDGWQPDAYLHRQPYFVTMPRLLIFETGVHFIDTYRFLGGEISGVFASLRKLNPSIAGEDNGMVWFEFANGARGYWDACRYHEADCDDPRYTFGRFFIEGQRGALWLDLDGTITYKALGEPSRVIDYPHARRGFAGDCVLATQQHFVDRLRDGQPFETSGTEYLKTLQVQEAVYQSAESGTPVRELDAPQ